MISTKLLISDLTGETVNRIVYDDSLEEEQQYKPPVGFTLADEKAEAAHVELASVTEEATQ